MGALITTELAAFAFGCAATYLVLKMLDRLK
jgi:hypothetical protein